MAAGSTSSLGPVKRSPLSPTFELPFYLDAEPYMQDLYNMSSNTYQSPFMGQLSAPTDQTDDLLASDATSSFMPSSTSSEGTWDEYIAWESLRSPMDPQPGWLSQTPREESNAPLFNDPSSAWMPSQEPQSSSSMISGVESMDFAPESNPPLTNTFNENTQTGSVDAVGDYLMTSGNTYSSLLTKTQTPTNLQDSGFVGRSASYKGRPSLGLALPPDSPTHSGSESPGSPIPHRTSPETEIPDLKKPRRGKSAAHNDVEKRYRTNLNVKIVELSASVPSLRRAAASENGSGDEIDTEPRSGYPSRGLKKATILQKATEYIKDLEGARTNLEDENKALKKRLALCGRIAADDELN